MITELQANQIFVFGSNLEGEHAGGAARQALDSFGAILNKGVGIQGQSYAIPTMGGLEQIAMYVVDFLEYAQLRPELEFIVTKIGTGIAGHKESDIAHMFYRAPTNVVLPNGWVDRIVNK